MVTAAEARQQITTQRAQITQRRAELQAVPTKVPITRIQLATATRMQQLARKRQEAQIRQAKLKAISQLGRQEVEFEKAVTLTEADITRQETAIAAAKIGATKPGIYQALEGALSEGGQTLSGKQASIILTGYGYTDPSERAKIMRQFSAQVYGGVYTKGGTEHYLPDKVDVVGTLPTIISPHVTVPSSTQPQTVITKDIDVDRMQVKYTEIPQDKIPSRVLEYTALKYIAPTPEPSKKVKLSFGQIIGGFFPFLGLTNLKQTQVSPILEPTVFKVMKKIRKFKDRPKSEFMKKLDVADVKISEFIKGDLTPEQRKLPFALGGQTIVQKYYEYSSYGFDKEGKFGQRIKFYDPGERKELVSEGLRDFNKADTYEEQQQAIKDLEKKGIKIDIITDPTTKEQYFQVEGEQAFKKFAPTSKFSNLLVGITDVLFKTTLFRQYFQRGGTKQKQTQKTKPKTKVIDGKAFDRALRNLKKEDIIKAYDKAVKSPINVRANNIKTVEEVIRRWYSPTKEGQAAANKLIASLKEQASTVYDFSGAGNRFAGTAPGANQFAGTAPTGLISDLGVMKTPFDTLVPPPEIPLAGELTGGIAGVSSLFNLAEESDFFSKVIGKPEVKKDTKTDVITKVGTGVILGTGAGSSLATGTVTVTAPTTAVLPSTTTITTTTPSTTTITAASTLTTTQQQYQQYQQSLLRQKQIERAPQQPKEIPKLFLGLGLGDMSRKKLGRIISKAFEVQVRRGGVFRTISKKPLPKMKALKLGATRVTKTLAATFRLKEKGTTKERDIGFKLSSKLFRLPKSPEEKLTFVEKKPYRLKKGTQEIPEILAIRGKKKKGRKFKWI